MVAVASSLRSWQIDQHWHDAPATAVVALKSGRVKAGSDVFVVLIVWWLPSETGEL
jgi:hypothetical protein